MKILIITSKPDSHLRMVSRHLPNTEFIILDPMKFPDLKLSYHYDKGEIKVKLNKSLISDVDVVWYRKPRFIESSKLPVDPNYQNFSWRNYRDGISWVYDLIPNAFWVSRPASIRVASNKLYQMQLGAAIGFKLPKTLVTNNAAEVKVFRAEVGDMVFKAIYPVLRTDADGIEYMFTNLIRNSDSFDLSGISVSPSIFQEVIYGQDIRVTVIGTKIFATKILKKGTIKGEIDWRLGTEDERKLGYKVVKLPIEIEEKCLQILSSLNLVFGAIDLIEDSDGNFWFLEINPNGQWGFIEQATKEPLSKAMADLFVNRI